MKVATYNVNSLRQRLPIVLDWITQHQPDVVCLQETKVQDQDFPVDAMRTAGYHATYRGMKGYNGVATLTRMPPSTSSTDSTRGPTTKTSASSKPS
jgi:exodeoxyribonuclease III